MRSGRRDESLMIIAILFLVEFDSFRVVLLLPLLLLFSRLVLVVRGNMCDILLPKNALELLERVCT
jgi:hypothetical protein